MLTSDIVGSALVVCVVVMLLCCGQEAFKVHPHRASHLADLDFRTKQTNPRAATYTKAASKISTFSGHLDDQGSIGHLNDMETMHRMRNVPNYDAPRDVQIDSRWLPDMDVIIERRSATDEDISAGNVPLDSLEYQRTRWAETDGPRGYGVSSHTHGKMVFGDEDEHRDVPDNFRTPYIDEQMVTYGDYGRGTVSI